MKKGKTVYILMSLILIIFLTGLVLAASQRRLISQCKKDCRLERREEIKICNEDYRSCRREYNEEKKSCLENTKNNYLVCREDCEDFEGVEKRQCRRNCSTQKRTDKKDCSKREELKICRNDRRECINGLKDDYLECSNECANTGLLLNQEECVNNGGFFYEICNGPYFDIICSQKKYCVCDGDNDYQCPEGYECNHDIKNFLPRKRHTIEGYKDLLGNDLGDIGVCQEDIVE